MNKFTGILTVIIFFFSTLFSTAQVIALKEKISISLKNTTAAAVVEELDKRTDYTFSYTREQLEKINIRSFVFNDITLGAALDLLRRLANVDINLLGNTIAIKVNAPQTVAPAPAGNAKPGKITGVVRNDKNEVMPGVTISVESTDRSNTTSVNGEYLLSLPAGTYTLVFSFVGYQTRRITDAIIKADEVTDLGVMLTAATKQMQAV